MKTMYKAMFGLSLAALLTTPAFAQGRGGFGRGGGGMGMLLGNASVQKELKLDDEQTSKAKDLATKVGEESREKFQSLGQDLSQEERREKMMAIGKEINETTMKAAGEFLKPDQIARLKQISIQTRGAQAFSDPEVAKKLNLTDSQKTEIQSIVTESQESMRGLFSQDQSPEDRAAAMKKRTEIAKETLAKVTAKLNDEQQKGWKDLIGAPFEIKFEPRPAQ